MHKNRSMLVGLLILVFFLVSPTYRGYAAPQESNVPVTVGIYIEDYYFTLQKVAFLLDVSEEITLHEFQVVEINQLHKCEFTEALGLEGLTIPGGTSQTINSDMCTITRVCVGDKYRYNLSMVYTLASDKEVRIAQAEGFTRVEEKFFQMNESTGVLTEEGCIHSQESPRRRRSFLNRDITYIIFFILILIFVVKVTKGFARRKMI